MSVDWQVIVVGVALGAAVGWVLGVLLDRVFFARVTAWL